MISAPQEELPSVTEQEPQPVPLPEASEDRLSSVQRRRRRAPALQPSLQLTDAAQSIALVPLVPGGPMQGQALTVYEVSCPETVWGLAFRASDGVPHILHLLQAPCSLVEVNPPTLKAGYHQRAPFQFWMTDGIWWCRPDSGEPKRLVRGALSEGAAGPAIEVIEQPLREAGLPVTKFASPSSPLRVHVLSREEVRVEALDRAAVPLRLRPRAAATVSYLARLFLSEDKEGDVHWAQAMKDLPGVAWRLNNPRGSWDSNLNRLRKTLDEYGLRRSLVVNSARNRFALHLIEGDVLVIDERPYRFDGVRAQRER